MINRYSRVLLLPLQLLLPLLLLPLLLHIIFQLEFIMVNIKELLLLLLVVQLVWLLRQLLHHTRFYSTKLSFLQNYLSIKVLSVYQ